MRQGPFLGPEGGYLAAGSGWMPTVEADWGRYRLRATVDAGQRVVATGRLTDERSSGDRYSISVQGEGAPEPPSLFTGPYRVAERWVDGVRFRTYFHPGLEEFSDSYLRAAGAFVERYSRSIGTYPFSDFHVISAPIPVGLGFPNLSYVSRRIVPLPYMRGRSLAHEVLHNWWGNGVYVAHRSGNWAEGLTTYLADHALAEEQGADAARDMRLAWLRDYAALPAGRDRPLSRFVAKTHDASQVVGYNKAAFVFHMLRQAIGDRAFDAGLRRLWSSHRFRIASWDDLATAFGDAAHQDLGEFFRQWVEQDGAPEIRPGAADLTLGASGVRLAFELLQDDRVYRLQVPVDIQLADRVARHRLQLDRAETRLILDLPDRPRTLSVDPDYDVFRRLLPGEASPILRDVTLAGAPTLIVVGDPAFRRTAGSLANRLLDQPASRIEAVSPAGLPGPALLIGPPVPLARLLRKLELPVPGEVAVPGTTARVWASATPTGVPVLAIEAEDEAALGALLGPLPHYGRQSWLAFQSDRAVEKGIWTGRESPLRIEF
jgi:hypothetical protein